jgi:hypothetical protein
VVGKRTDERREQKLRLEASQAVELVFETSRRLLGVWHQKVREVRPKDEPEEFDAPPQLCVKTAHAANPRMLQCVVLWPEKGMEAEHALQERGGRERNVLLGALRERDSDHLFLRSEEQLPRPSRVATIIAMRLILLIACLLAASALSTGAGGASSRVLLAKVGLHDSYRITLTLANGRRVRTLPAGTYTIVVQDYSTLHNFALGSVTQNRRLFTGSVGGTGIKRYTLKLTAGTYAYACSAHPQTMHGTFVVVSNP